MKDLSKQPIDAQLLSPDYHFGVAEALKKEVDEAFAAAEMLSPNRAIQYAYCAEALRRANEEIGKLKARIADLEAQRAEGE